MAKLVAGLALLLLAACETHYRDLDGNRGQAGFERAAAQCRSQPGWFMSGGGRSYLDDCLLASGWQRID